MVRAAFIFVLAYFFGSVAISAPCVLDLSYQVKLPQLPVPRANPIEGEYRNLDGFIEYSDGFIHLNRSAPATPHPDSIAAKIGVVQLMNSQSLLPGIGKVIQRLNLNSEDSKLKILPYFASGLAPDDSYSRYRAMGIILISVSGTNYTHDIFDHVPGYYIISQTPEWIEIQSVQRRIYQRLDGEIEAGQRETLGEHLKKIGQMLELHSYMIAGANRQSDPDIIQAKMAEFRQDWTTLKIHAELALKGISLLE